MKILSKLMLVICALLILFTVVFATNNPISNKYKLLIVMSGSMEPVIDTKDVILIEKEDQYKIGDVITFAVSETKSYTHRIVEETEEGFVTKGDANNANDSGVVIQENIVGKYLFSIPLIGTVILAIKQIPVGYIMLFILLAVGLIVFYGVYALLTRNEEDDDEVETSKKDTSNNPTIIDVKYTNVDKNSLREKLYDVSEEEDE